MIIEGSQKSSKKLKILLYKTDEMEIFMLSP